MRCDRPGEEPSPYRPPAAELLEGRPPDAAGCRGAAVAGVATWAATWAVGLAFFAVTGARFATDLDPELGVVMPLVWSMLGCVVSLLPAFVTAAVHLGSRSRRLRWTVATSVASGLATLAATWAAFS
jgi:hypothetical protein